MNIIKLRFSQQGRKTIKSTRTMGTVPTRTFDLHQQLNKNNSYSQGVKASNTSYTSYCAIILVGFLAMTNLHLSPIVLFWGKQLIALQTRTSNFGSLAKGYYFPKGDFPGQSFQMHSEYLGANLFVCDLLFDPHLVTPCPVGHNK